MRTGFTTHRPRPWPRPSRLAAVSVGVTVLLIGSLAAAQLPSADQRAFAGVDSAVARFNGASDRNEMVRAAGQILAAAESALNAFAAADRARDAAAARFTAADRQLFDTVVHYRRPENSRTSHSTPSGGSASTSVGSISLSQSQYLRAESMSTCSDASSPKPK